MTPILRQFLTESRDVIESIGEKLIRLENSPQDPALMSELFRLVHTLKGNSGLFDFPEMSRALHAAEDVMAVVRDGDLAYSQPLADRLLETIDFVSLLLDDIEGGSSGTQHATTAVKVAEALRQLIATQPAGGAGAMVEKAAIPEPSPSMASIGLPPLTDIPEQLRMSWYGRASAAQPLLWISYSPEPECFFKGEDPFFQARQTPEIVWQRVIPSMPWPPLPELDAFRSVLCFQLMSTASRKIIEEHFRYVVDQISIVAVPGIDLALPSGERDDGSAHEDFVAQALADLERGDLASLKIASVAELELSPSGLWVTSALRWLLLIIGREPHQLQALRTLIESIRPRPAKPGADGATVRAAQDPVQANLNDPRNSSNGAQAALVISDAVIGAQLAVLGMPDQVPWLAGRLKAVAATLSACYRSRQRDDRLPEIETQLAASLGMSSAVPLLSWLTQVVALESTPATQQPPVSGASPEELDVSSPHPANGEHKLGRRDDAAAKTLKVDQAKVDGLMNLIGELVVAKNGLPFLATRAETVFGVRELSREIKAQYDVINRIAEEMQDAILQVRMMPVSVVFQRFPRLVRDISRKLGKEVSLVLEGEETEADKNIIEALADPLIHIIRNSLDHGIEQPQVRRLAGKAAEGRLLIRASQEADRVVIDVSDDGKGIDPAIIKRKAYEKGLIDEATLERISDQDAINLVFSAGFSTADVVSDLSGRGVGMDVVRTAVERVDGSVTLESTLGQGTRLRLSLPLSMAVTNVMIIESDRQIFGVPMDVILETLRVPRSAIHSIKNNMTTVLRDRIVPLRSLNELLALARPQRTNDEDELATLVVRFQGEHVGIVVDNFREVVDIILKPLDGILGGLSGCAGSALLGDGSVLMVLNPKELLS